MKLRCMLCGRSFEEDIVKKDPFDDEDDYDERFKKKSTSVCLMCQAKLKHEADGSQKNPKPL
ncbi:MAG: hypothetical protein A4E53_01989 [Pelotomaculum sp. PtaB.Bin104]|nr:MAG: hypothetical protein A4E53_01989 [Pelotomaculum sp. PtaB.Bin104]